MDVQAVSKVGYGGYIDGKTNCGPASRESCHSCGSRNPVGDIVGKQTRYKR